MATSLLVYLFDFLKSGSSETLLFVAVSASGQGLQESPQKKMPVFA